MKLRAKNGFKNSSRRPSATTIPAVKSTLVDINTNGVSCLILLKPFLKLTNNRYAYVALKLYLTNQFKALSEEFLIIISTPIIKNHDYHINFNPALEF